jgi:hypothetical protein
VPFRAYFDEQNISPNAQSDYLGNAEFFKTGGFGRDGGFAEDWGSSVFSIDKPGPHTLRFVGLPSKAPAGSCVTLDNIALASADAIMDSGFGSGSALGQPEEAHWGKAQTVDSRFGWSFGLPRVAYEAGWSLGGDFDQKPIETFCKLRDPRAGKINDQAIDIFSRAGGRMQVFGVYTYWPFEDFGHGAGYPIMNSIIRANGQLPADPTNGTAIPATLTTQNAVSWGIPADLSAPGKWLSWTMICPSMAVYRFNAETSEGGRIELEADGVSLGTPQVSGKPLEYAVRMTKGMHGVRLRNLSGNVTLKQISVTAAP